MSVEITDEVFLAMRYAVIALVQERNVAKRDIPKSVADIYPALRDNTLTASGHETFKLVCGRTELEQAGDIIGTAAAAALLGWSERTVRRRARELGGIRPTGRDLVFRRRYVAAYAQAYRKDHHSELAKRGNPSE
ncbi:hypothetical protein [Mycolicibacterium cosmeticum]|uniref:hypothetical protein n=1 Tax=Mycolicibacterium cosmeticum TaxID=258533 RepID=UPI003204D428